MSFWKDKSVLVTGANGFIGAHVIKALVKKQARVIAIVRRKNSRQSLFNYESLHNKVTVIENISIENYSYIQKIIRENKIQIIYHLAAQPLVEVGKKNPLLTFRVNIKGTWNILEAARKNKVEKIVVASTTHVYGENKNLPYKEEYFPQPSRPYETSKACADLLSQTYADSYGLPVEIPRFTNIYGPGDFNVSRLIPKMITSVLKGNDISVWDIGTMRDFLFIDDAVNAYIRLVESQLPNTKRNRIFNFGSGKPVEVISIANEIVKLFGSEHVKVNLLPVPKQREKEILKQYVHIQKAKEIIDWEPQVDLPQGLQKTIIWYKKYLEQSVNTLQSFKYI